MNYNISDIEKLRAYINDLEEQAIPLTKKNTTKQSPAKVVEAPIIEETKEIKQVPEVETKAPEKPKIKRTMTDKKRTQLENARAKKQENLVAKQKIKKLESAKLLLADELAQPKQPPKPVFKQSKKIEVIDDDDEPEPEIIFVKKTKKPKKKIVIESDDSSSGGSEDSDHEPRKLKDFGKSHKNKKSVVKVNHQPAVRPSIHNYFCD